MLKTTLMLEDELSTYANPRNKIGRMVASGALTPVRRGLYETSRSTPGHCPAQSVYGPSYLSFEYALAYHGLIPEQVRIYTSATCGKNRSKRYESPFGVFVYRDVPVAAFSRSVLLRHEGDLPYWIASPEKALCDELYKLPPVTNRSQLEALLLDDLRIDFENLAALDAKLVRDLAPRYRCRSVNQLAAFLERTTHEQHA